MGIMVPCYQIEHSGLFGNELDKVTIVQSGNDDADQVALKAALIKMVTDNVLEDGDQFSITTGESEQ